VNGYFFASNDGPAAFIGGIGGEAFQAPRSHEHRFVAWQNTSSDDPAENHDRQFAHSTNSSGAGMDGRSCKLRARVRESH
jgi:hypothetical protein